MYNGKYSGKKSRILRKRHIALMLSMALLLVGLVGGSLAYLFMSSQSVENTFTQAFVKTSVQETFDGAEKKDVAIRNDGNISAYIRAKVIINWQTEGGLVYGEAPQAGVDYKIVYNEKSWTWEKTDDFWYHNGAVAPGEKTSDLIVSCTPTDTGLFRKDDQGNTYYLTVTILGSGIQAKGIGVDTAQAAWAAAKN